MAGKDDWASDLNPFAGCNTGCTIFVFVVAVLVGAAVVAIIKLV